MSFAIIFLVVLILLALLLGGLLVGLFNKLVTFRNRYKNAFAQIEVQLKRRYDLIPNVVETVKGYAAHEQKTLEAVVAARSSAMSTQSPEQKGQSEACSAAHSSRCWA